MHSVSFLVCNHFLRQIGRFQWYILADIFKRNSEGKNNILLVLLNKFSFTAQQETHKQI